jgi:hypothetical protein
MLSQGSAALHGLLSSCTKFLLKNIASKLQTYNVLFGDSGVFAIGLHHG